MASFNYKSGLGSVGQYQMSAVPYATSSLTVPELGTAPLEVAFPRVSKFVTIRNTFPTASAPRALRVGFSSVGTSGSVDAGREAFQNYVILKNGESYTGEWRVSSVYLLCDTKPETSASVIAGLTLISTSSVSFENWTGSLGIG